MVEDRRIVEMLAAAIPGLIAVYRFGSTAGGQTHPGSDVDLAFLAATALDPVARFHLQEEVALQLRRDVDLIDLRVASTVMRMQVVSTGILILVVDAAEQERFEDHAYVAYARLNEERREILQQVRKEGRIYGG